MYVDMPCHGLIFFPFLLPSPSTIWKNKSKHEHNVGLGPFAWDFAVARVMSQGRTENSLFPGYLASDASDGAPQVESNGIVAETLQRMLIQTDGRRILLLPAFVKGVDVDYLLTVPGNVSAGYSPATVRLVWTGGSVEVLTVTPASRQADVVMLMSE